MSQPDQSAAAAIVRHHAELSAALGELSAELVVAAELGSLRPAYAARDALVGWVRAELLPHAFAEEEALYPAAARQAGGRLLVEGMLAEHKAIAALVDELETAASPVAAAAAGRALRAVFEAHLAKENELIVPLLAEAPDVDLAGLLAGMHELIGPEEAAAAGGCGCGGCGCGGEARAAEVVGIEARPRA